MTISEDLKLKLNANQREIYITDADDLLAAWRHRTELMTCHVSMWSHSSHLKETIRPVPEYSVMSCHGHGRAVKLTTDDLNALNATSFTRRNVAPYISPILDIATLTLVCKDLGISGKAIPKVIKGRQYIAFSGHPGLRTIFPGTIYSVNNRKIIKMAIGSLGLKNLVKSGGVLTIYITVPLTVLECYLKDQSSFYLLAGNLASDLIKIGIGSLMGAIAGLTIRRFTSLVSVPIGLAVFICVGAGEALNYLDAKYQLTEKLSELLEDMSYQIEKSIKNSVDDVQRSVYRGLNGFIRSQGYRGAL